MGQPSSTRRVVAAFDIDGTLTTRDCVVPFLRSVAGTPALVGEFVRHPVQAVRHVLRHDREALKTMALAPLAGRRLADINDAGERFAADVVPGWLRPDTVARLQQHLAAHHLVVLVSASLAPYVHPLARRLGADAALCSELETEDGLLTGRLSGSNCRGPEKVRRLRQWLTETCGTPESAELWAYGDSSGDRELLAWAAHSFKIVRNKPLGGMAE
jgi:phosphatidylglycerophosphatase C